MPLITLSLHALFITLHDIEVIFKNMFRLDLPAKRLDELSRSHSRRARNLKKVNFRQRPELVEGRCWHLETLKVKSLENVYMFWHNSENQ